MADWRPIDTAPRDGTEFMAWVTNPEYDPKDKGWMECRCHFEHGDFFVWGYSDYDGDYAWYHHPPLAPTHWMPQPSPPSE